MKIADVKAHDRDRRRRRPSRDRLLVAALVTLAAAAACGLLPDGDSFESTIRLRLLDQSGNLPEPDAVATAKASRIGIR